MNKFRCAAAILGAALVVAAMGLIVSRHGVETQLPGMQARRTVLLRVWDVSGPTGSSAWLRKQCAAFEKQHPQVSVYIRHVPASECLAEEAVLPDLIAFSGGTFTAPEQLFSPLTGIANVRENYLQSGRWKNEQYVLPLAAEGWVLAVQRSLAGEQATPAPTSLLGRAAATPNTSSVPTVTPPVEALRTQAIPLAAEAQGLFTLEAWLGANTLPLQTESTQKAATLFRQGKATAALVSTGAFARLDAQTTAVFVPREALAPRVLYMGLTRNANAEAAALLQALMGEEAQRALSQAQLFPVREGIALYPHAPWSDMEYALRTGCLVNAFWPQERVDTAARDAYLGRRDADTALAELR